MGRVGLMGVLVGGMCLGLLIWRVCLIMQTAFNQDLNDWDVSSVTTMKNMFSDTEVFNGNISGWDVSSVTDMSHMFFQADVFNQDLNDWDVSSVTDYGRVCLTAANWFQRGC